MEKALIFKKSLLIGICFSNILYLGANAQIKSLESADNTISSKSFSTRSTNPKPEPAGWYSGDIYVHHRCLEPNTIPENNLKEMMGKNNLDVVSVLAEKENLRDDRMDLSAQDRIIHQDAEWYNKRLQKTNQSIGSHFALLGINENFLTNEKYDYKILEWAKKQNSVIGFISMKYFKDWIGNTSSCCIPMDYPVEAALGMIDFVAEDSQSNEASIRAWYKLLNCGFRIGLAASTDGSCNNASPGDVLTYVQVKEKPLTYEKWIEGIKNGRTVVSLNGHNEFLDIRANGSNTPGDEIKIKGQGDVNVMVRWVAGKELTGRVELLCNGKVVATQRGTARPGSSVILTATQKFIRSGWLSARRTDDKGYVTHTAPIYVMVDNQPIRASIDDAKYFISWIDNVLANVSPGGASNNFFGKDSENIKARFERARDIYIKIEDETLDQLKNMGDGVLDNGSVAKSPVKKPVKKSVRHKSKSVRKH